MNRSQKPKVKSGWASYTPRTTWPPYPPAPTASSSTGSESPAVPASNNAGSTDSLKVPSEVGSGLVTSTAQSVSNAYFIKAIFGPLEQDVNALVCSKEGDPTEGGWLPKPATQVEAVCHDGRNNYFNCSSFRAGDDGRWYSRKANVVAFHCLVLDDVGTKVPSNMLRGFKATWAIETSPGNYQLGIALAQPLTSHAEVAWLQDAVVAAGLCDAGATGMTRWARSPVGINGKEKYRAATGEAFHCRLVKWRPELRYSVEEIVAALNLTMPPIQGGVSDASTPMVGMASDGPVIEADVAKLPQLLAAINPDCDRKRWITVLMAVHHTTQGSVDGLALVDAWSSKCKARYKGTKDVEVQWASLGGRASDERSVTIATLVSMARESGANIVVNKHSAADAFESCTTDTVAHGQVTEATPLARFSLKDDLLELERQRVDQILIFGQLVLLGQATAIYARPNTGKTLIFLRLIVEAIKGELIDPAKLIYINMDDNSSGLVDKVRLAQEYGFHMAADGHKGFQAKEFRVAMEKMVAEDTAHGVIVFLDTLKKFANTMNKDDSRLFTAMVRRFCLKGGTVVTLSHVNKNPGANGKAVYTGTTDIVDDFDCAYTLETVAEKTDSKEKVVEFTNIKRRGDVAMTAAYSYSTERSLAYDELLLSVLEVDPAKLSPLKQAEGIKSDATVIAAVKSCIAEGVNTKMMMIDAASKRIGVSTRTVLKVIEKYTGSDTSHHCWAFDVGPRGAKIFRLLVGPAPPFSDVPAGEAF